MTNTSKYIVTYRNMRNDQSSTREFPSLSAAKKWAREFVAESFRNEASAVVYEDGSCAETMTRYDNVNGRAKMVQP